MWPATERYVDVAAPGGLGLVQDLLNTISAGRPRRPDLLADLASARLWLDGAMRAWARTQGTVPSGISLRPADLEVLLDLRSDVACAVAEAGPAGVSRPVALAVRFGDDGILTVQPRGEGVRRLVGAVLMECLLAQRLGTWRRLKTCRDPRCSAAFYDRSRNNSGVWHDVRGCGNAANLRASRARRRTS